MIWYLHLFPKRVRVWLMVREYNKRVRRMLQKSYEQYPNIHRRNVVANAWREYIEHEHVTAAEFNENWDRMLEQVKKPAPESEAG